MRPSLCQAYAGAAKEKRYRQILGHIDRKLGQVNWELISAHDTAPQKLITFIHRVQQRDRDIHTAEQVSGDNASRQTARQGVLYC